MAHLSVMLTVVPGGLRVAWRLEGVTMAAGERLAQLPSSIAGVPTVRLADDGVAASDDLGPVPLKVEWTEDEDGDQVRGWSVGRATSGAIEVAHFAEPANGEPRPASPPLDLRAEAGGLSGAVKCFVVLPPGPADLAFELRWIGPAGNSAWTAVTSLAESDSDGDGDSDGAGGCIGSGLELLGDTYVMCGDLAGRHHRDGRVSTWWLTHPGIDVEAFTTRLGATYAVMAEAFGVPAHAYRVFLRGHPHRGAAASAHPASFVMAVNPAEPLGEASLYETIAHELVHEWLQLDGAAHEIAWFVEGSADYYSLVLPYRAGLIDEAAFVRAVNFSAREAYANPRRHLDLREAQRLFFADFLAHRLAYARGLFYLADLNSRLHNASGTQTVDDLVRALVRRRAAGERFGIDEWCAGVEEVLSEPERPNLAALVFAGTGRPALDCFGPRLAGELVPVPVPDFGFDPSTMVTRQVRGLVPGGAADRAGLREGETVELPRYPEIMRRDVGDVLDVGVTRDGVPVRIALPVSAETALVPQWRIASGDQ